MGSEQIKSLADSMLKSGKYTREQVDDAMGNLYNALRNSPRDTKNSIFTNENMDSESFSDSFKNLVGEKNYYDGLEDDAAILFEVIDQDKSGDLSAEEIQNAFKINGNSKVSRAAVVSTLAGYVNSKEEVVSTNTKEDVTPKSSGEITMNEEDTEFAYWVDDFENALRTGDKVELQKMLNNKDITPGDLAKILRAVQDNLGEGESIISLYNKAQGGFINDEYWSDYPTIGPMWKKVREAALAGNEDAILVLARETHYLMNGDVSNPFINVIFTKPEDTPNDNDYKVIKRIYEKYKELYDSDLYEDIQKRDWYGHGSDHYTIIVKEARRIRIN